MNFDMHMSNDIHYNIKWSNSSSEALGPRGRLSGSSGPWNFPVYFWEIHGRISMKFEREIGYQATDRRSWPEFRYKAQGRRGRPWDVQQPSAVTKQRTGLSQWILICTCPTTFTTTSSGQTPRVRLWGPGGASQDHPGPEIPRPIFQGFMNGFEWN
jgi:hypothetical protein